MTSHPSPCKTPKPQGGKNLLEFEDLSQGLQEKPKNAFLVFTQTRQHLNDS